MNLHVIDTGLFKLDGGAMFGVVPKTLWSKGIPPDEKNLCTWAMRCLLVVDGDRKILINNGIDDKHAVACLARPGAHGVTRPTNHHARLSLPSRQHYSGGVRRIFISLVLLTLGIFAAGAQEKN